MPRQRKKPIVGLKVLNDFAHDAKKNKWNGGTAYDPDSGKNYKYEVKFEQDPKDAKKKRLNVRGYIGLPAFGITTYWSRVPKADLIKLKLIEEEKANASE